MVVFCCYFVAGIAPHAIRAPGTAVYEEPDFFYFFSVKRFQTENFSHTYSWQLACTVAPKVKNVPVYLNTCTPVLCIPGKMVICTLGVRFSSPCVRIRTICNGGKRGEPGEKPGK